MKPFIAPLAVALACLSTTAQAGDLKIYGMLDVGLRHSPNLAVSEDAITKVDDGARSRIGFRGTEDIAPGLKAFFRLEHSLRMDTGAMRESIFWDDKAWVGLDSATFGMVKLGRVRSAIDDYTDGTRFEAFMGHTLGASGGRGAGATDAWNNALYYVSPSWHGFMVGGGFSAGEGANKSSTGGHVEYTQGPLDVALAFQRDGESLSSTRSTVSLAGTYQFPGFKLLGTYAKTRDMGAADSGQRSSWSLGARVPAFAGEVRVSLRQTHDDQVNGLRDFSKDVDLRHVGLGYHHPLSKRASVNATVSHDQRKTYSTSGSVLAQRSGPGMELGLRVSF